MTITKERLLELVRKVGGVMKPGLAPVFCSHAEVHKLAQLIRNEVLEEAAQELKVQADYSGSNRRSFYMDAFEIVRAMKEQL